MSQRSFYYHCRRHSASRAFFVKEERRRLCLNCVKPVKTPQPELLDWSILFSLVKLVFECENPFIDKPMVITEPSVPIAPLGRHLYPSNKLTFSSQWLSRDISLFLHEISLSLEISVHKSLRIKKNEDSTSRI